MDWCCLMCGWNDGVDEVELGEVVDYECDVSGELCIYC